MLAIGVRSGLRKGSKSGFYSYPVDKENPITSYESITSIPWLLKFVMISQAFGGFRGDSLLRCAVDAVEKDDESLRGINRRFKARCESQKTSKQNIKKSII